MNGLSISCTSWSVLILKVGDKKKGELQYLLSQRGHTCRTYVWL